MFLREGGARWKDKQIGQGNGLYGTWRICELSKGRFHIFSGNASLASTPQGGLHIQNEPIPFAGTLVIGSINYADPVDLSEALHFAGKKHNPIDFVDLAFDEDAASNVHFLLAKEAQGLGSRAAGDPVRRRLSNLSRLAREGRIIVGLTGTPIMSSSFADEVFGKLYAEMGIVGFSRHIELRNVDPLVRQLIEKAVNQRISSMSSKS